MKKFLNVVISRIKKEKYKIDENISNGYLILLCLKRIRMLIKGMIFKIFFKECQGKIFVGKNVILKSKHQIEILGNATIDDNCYIDALSVNGIKIGENFSLGRNSHIECTGVIRNIGEGIEIGDNVGISPFAFIGARGKIKIGNDTIIGPYLKMHSENHTFRDKTQKIRKQGEERIGIAIGNDCWLGSNVTILDGVTIGDGVIVAAGSVVTKSFGDNLIIGGVPAKVIKKR